MEFTEPPAASRGARSEYWINVVKELQAHPGEWARVGNWSPGVATQIRRGRYKAFLQGYEGDDTQLTLYMKRHWDVTTRKTDNGSRNDIWIRWIG